ncbi:MAG: IS200/IS605 family transposase [Deltaproteobacteria bacterium]
MKYRKGAHTIYQLHYHFVFVPKYRKPVLRAAVGVRVRDLIRQICQANDVEILKGHVRPDHVHLLLSVPPKLAPSRVMQLIKGKTSHKLLREFRHINRAFWGKHVWARGYFVATSGTVSDEVIAKYIEEQDVARPDDDDFKVTE